MGKTISRLSRIEELKETDIIIAVVGGSGTGKSTFINTAAGKVILSVNHGLTPYASDVRHVECSCREFRDRRVVFVDVPAFDSERDEGMVEMKLQRWRKKFASKRARIAGILYLHRITDPRLSDPPAPRLAMLKSLCESSGGDFPSRVALVTTMWTNVQPSDHGRGRERELRMYLGRALTGGVSWQIFRFEDSFESAWSITFALLGLGGKPGITRDLGERERIERESRRQWVKRESEHRERHEQGEDRASAYESPPLEPTPSTSSSNHSAVEARTAGATSERPSNPHPPSPSPSSVVDYDYYRAESSADSVESTEDLPPIAALYMSPTKSWLGIAVGAGAPSQIGPGGEPRDGEPPGLGPRERIDRDREKYREQGRDGERDRMERKIYRTLDLRDQKRMNSRDKIKSDYPNPFSLSMANLGIGPSSGNHTPKLPPLPGPAEDIRPFTIEYPSEVWGI